MSDILIMPGTPDYDETIATIMPFNWRDIAEKEGYPSFIVKSDTGLMQAATQQETLDYLYGGEYDQRMAELDDYNAMYDDEEENIELYNNVLCY